jgi:hypothetical protein
MEIEFTRMALVYAHLIACCVAIGMVFTSDIAMVKQLLRANARERMDAAHLQDLQTTVSYALIALWVSGIAIVGLDASIKGWEYFANPKLQSKITIVVLLTINGFLLHRYVMPLMAHTGSLLNMKFSDRSMAIFSGAVSGVSWFYAAMLGVGRPLNWKYSLVQILAAYPVLIIGGFVSMSLLTAWAVRKSGVYKNLLATRTSTARRVGERPSYHRSIMLGA